MYNVTGYRRRTSVYISVLAGVLGTFCMCLSNYVGFIDELSFDNLIMLGVIIFFTAFITPLLLQVHFLKHLKILRQILDELRAVVVIKDYDGNFVFCNETVAKLYGTYPENMAGKDDYYFTGNREQADFFLENVRSIMDHNRTEEVYESSTDTNSGEIRHFQSVKIPYIDSNGARKIVVLAKDITDIVELKEEADRNKRRLEHVLDVSQEGLWEWNVQTNDVFHNRQWECLTGIDSSEQTFKEFEEAVVEEDRAMVQQALKELVENNKSYNIEFRLKKPNGDIVWVWDRGRIAEMDKHGAPLWIVGIAQDITLAKRDQLQIENLAYHDQLTGLYNRTQMRICLDEAIRQSLHSKRYSAVLYLDLDRFKLLNDSYGHHMGDRLLKLVATRLERVNAGRATLSRFGGDEFVIVYADIASKEIDAMEVVHSYAQELISEISKTMTIKSTVQEMKIEYDIAVSVGGVIFNSDKKTQDALIQLADIALYRSKSSNSQCAVIFNAETQNDLVAQTELLKDMRDAINNNDFIIYLQPKVNMKSQLVGAEALVRWIHPQRGILTPATFIDLAEETNLIIDIGASVLEQSCQLLEQWSTTKERCHLTLSVNLSAKQIWRSQFVEDVISTVKKYRFERSRLIIEVTESLLIQDIKDACEKLSRLKQFGLQVSLDDFGTGFSSLNYLRHLPINEIKIDRSFMNDSTFDVQARLMIKSIIDLAQNFNLRVVAEGVEQQDQYDLLKNYSVDEYQGFLFSPPISSMQFSNKWLKRGRDKDMDESSA